VTRRSFLESAGIASTTLNAFGQNNAMEIPKRPLGKTGLQTSIIGVGGYHLGSAQDEATAKRIVDEAIDAGVNFFDNCWDYHNGRSEEWMGSTLKGKRDKVILMTKVCTHGRTKDVGMRMLEESLRRLQTDHIDVWQIHEVIYYNDPDLIFAAHGAIGYQRGGRFLPRAAGDRPRAGQFSGRGLIERQQPASASGHRLKFFYATQVRQAPPTFLLFVNRADLFSDQYRKYLTQEMRRAFGFEGCPIILAARAREKTIEPVRRRRRRER